MEQAIKAELEAFVKAQDNYQETLKTLDARKVMKAAYAIDCAALDLANAVRTYSERC